MLPIDYQLRMKELLSDEYESFIKSFEAPEYRALRLNPLKVDRAQLPAFIRRFADELSWEGTEVSFEPVPWEKCGYYYFGPDDLKLGNQVYHEAGAYYIQEPSAMKPVTMLDVRPGDKVLDLCAAPGGKSTQLAGYMEGRGLLVCNEIISSRAAVLSRNIERMGVRNAVVLNETPQKLNDTFVDFFDKILVDAPCSGEGMFRKNHEAIAEWSIDNVSKCAARQDSILDCAASMLKSGGRLIYSTCTFSKEEDEECIGRFLGRHPDYKLIGMEKLFPHRIKGEGHFMAVLERTGTHTGGYCITGDERRPGRSSDRNDVERLKLFDDFCRDALRNVKCEGIGDAPVLVGLLSGRLIFFGDNLYLLPEGIKEPAGLKVERPGLQLGSYTGDKKSKSTGRFIPSHSLALALKPGETKATVDITLEKARAYMEGLTLPVDETVTQETGNIMGKGGWCLVCCGGISLGWGKIAGGIIKNHYPKGLRVRLRG
ncbi:MAG: RsmF rRNA methyltransferase first C-terminal domain-containing protein [Lachnospiraceae bacterium]|nr:RsmF rRNA methyltransferase first C-terminal domain-containing protein [Lachnospiraceae bacterium]